MPSVSVVVYEADDGSKSRTIQHHPVVYVSGVRWDPLNIHFPVVRFHYWGNELTYILETRGDDLLFAWTPRMSGGLPSLIVFPFFDPAKA